MKRLIFVAMLVAGCGGQEPIVSAAGTWDGSFRMQSGPATLTMSIVQDNAGHLTGPAMLNADAGTIDGDINGKENAYITLHFPTTTVVMQMTGLPTRMFGSVYINGSTVVVDFARH